VGRAGSIDVRAAQGKEILVVASGVRTIELLLHVAGDELELGALLLVEVLGELGAEADECPAAVEHAEGEVHGVAHTLDVHRVDRVVIADGREEAVKRLVDVEQSEEGAVGEGVHGARHGLLMGRLALVVEVVEDRVTIEAVSCWHAELVVGEALRAGEGVVRGDGGERLALRARTRGVRGGLLDLAFDEVHALVDLGEAIGEL